MAKDKSDSVEKAKDFDWIKPDIENDKKRARGYDRVGHIVAIPFILFFAYLINHYWSHFDFMKESFTAVLWVYNISVAVAVLSNLLQALVKAHWVHHFCKLLENCASLIVLIVFYGVFPLDISSGAETSVRAIIIFLMICTGIAVIVEFIRTLTDSKEE